MMSSTIKILTFYPDDSRISSLIFEISEKYDVYVPYIDYQPVVNQERRNLASDDQDNIMSTPYFIFYFISQIGGFWSFFILIIGPQIRHINEAHLTQKMINDYKEMVSQERSEMDQKRLLLSNAGKSYKTYYTNSNYLRKSINPQSSSSHEKHKSIEQNEGGSSDENEYDINENQEINQHANKQYKDNTHRHSSFERKKQKFRRKKSKDKTYVDNQKVEHKRRRNATNKKPESTNPDHNELDLTIYGYKDLMYTIFCCWKQRPSTSTRYERYK